MESSRLRIVSGSGLCISPDVIFSKKNSETCILSFYVLEDPLFCPWPKWRTTCQLLLLCDSGSTAAQSLSSSCFLQSLHSMRRSSSLLLQLDQWCLFEWWGKILFSKRNRQGHHIGPPSWQKALCIWDFRELKGPGCHIQGPMKKKNEEQSFWGYQEDRLDSITFWSCYFWVWKQPLKPQLLKGR